MKIFGKWNLFEILLLVIGLGGIVACFFVSTEKNYLSLFVSIVGVVSVMFTAKKLQFAPVISIGYNILYAIVAYSQRFYGEVMVYLCVLLPLSIMTLIGWLKSKANEDATINPKKIGKEEIIILSVLILPIAIGMYFLLNALNTPNLIVCTISFVTALYASYLLFRKNAFYAVIYTINSIFVIILWTITTIEQGVQFLPFPQP